MAQRVFSGTPPIEKKTMSNRRLIILISLAILIALTAIACGPTSPTVTPTAALPTSEGSIDVGGYKLNYQCFGQGSPTVIVEAGSGDKPVVSFTWREVTQDHHADLHL